MNNRLINKIIRYKNHEKDKQFYKIENKIYCLNITKNTYLDQIDYYMKNKFQFFKNLYLENEIFEPIKPDLLNTKSIFPLEFIENFFLEQLNKTILNIDYKTEFKIKIKRSIFHPKPVDDSELQVEILSLIKRDNDYLCNEEELKFLSKEFELMRSRSSSFKSDSPRFSEDNILINNYSKNFQITFSEFKNYDKND